MQYTHMFSYNIPAENQLCGYTDRYIHILCEWDGVTFYSNDRPMIRVSPVNLSFAECISVKNWLKAHNDIEKIAESHFAEIARQEKINQARAVLATEENPVLERLMIEHLIPLS